MSNSALPRNGQELHFVYMKQPEERFDILRRVEDLSLAKLEELTRIDQKRWGTVKRRAGKMRAEEIQALAKLFLNTLCGLLQVKNKLMQARSAL